MKKLENGTGLPKPLRIYSDSDFIARQRAKFLYYLCLALIGAVTALIVNRLLSYPLSNISDTTHLTVLLPLLFLFILLLASLWLLIRGYYTISAGLLPILVMAITWGIMFMEKESLLIRLDTIVNIFAALSMIPLLIEKRKWIILLYPAVNIVILFIFIANTRSYFEMSSAEITDYLSDSSIALIFVGVVGYYIFNINKSALERAEADIRKRVEMEEALSVSEKKFREMTELLPQIVAETDINGNVTYLNKAGKAKFGFSEEDLRQGVNLLSVFIETDEIRSGMEKVLKGGRSDKQYTAIHKNGKRFPVQFYSGVIIENGAPVGFRGVLVDISDMLKAEEAMKASEKKFREMSQLLPQTVYESDLRGMLTYINKAGTEMFGYSFEEVEKGINVLSTMTEQDRPIASRNIKGVLSGEITQGNHYTGLRKDGTTFPIQIYSAPIIESGKPVGFRGVVYDISEMVKAQEELRQSNELFKTLVESLPVSITLSDMDRRFLMANKTFYDDLELTPEAVIGKTAEELGITTNNETEETMNRMLIEKGYVKNIELAARDRNNKRSVMYVSQNIVEVNNQKAIIRTNIDVTEKKKLEEQLREYNQKLEYLVKERTDELLAANQELQTTNEELYSQREQLESTLKKLREAQEQLIHTEKMASLGILTAGVAHEINNPVNYIYNGAIAIENYINENMPDHLLKLKPLFEAINTGIDRTTNIVKSLNRFSRNDEARLHNCNIHEILDNCLTMLFSQYKSRIEISKDYVQGLPVIMASEAKLHQAFLNILTNAIQAIEDKGEISITTLLSKDKVEVHIADSGKGICNEDMKHIYDPFFTTKDPGKGTGLGLSITQRIIQEHKGTIQCKSQPDSGSEFIISIPIK